MPTVAVLNMAGKEVEKIELAEGVFGIEPNVSVMNDMVKAYLANQRQGTQSALTRSEVSGGGEGTSPVGRPGPVTPWGKPALGYKTRSKKKASNKFIVKRRNGK